jgi:hypothetical protein
MAFTKVGVLDYLRTHRVQLAFFLAEGETKPLDRCTPGPVARTLEFPSGVRFDVKAVEQGVNATLEVRYAQSPAETGIRYLPWEPDRCTYVRLDAAAELIFTGPLSGCNIYVAGPKTAPVLFHANSNTNAADAASNNADKQTMALNLLAANVLGLAPSTTIAGKLERAVYSGNYLGFVVGRKKGTDWEFYFNGTGADSTVLKRIL